MEGVTKQRDTIAQQRGEGVTKQRDTIAQQRGGLSSYESSSFSIFTAGASQDITKNKKTGKSEIGQTWQFYSVGITVGSSDIIQGAGSAGIEYTSSPFYIFDFNKNTNKSNNEEKKTSNNIENNTNNNESINEDN